MGCLRRAAGRIAVTWLLSHIATLGVATAVLWAGPEAPLLECRCTHGEHAFCPMHHKPTPGSKLCSMTSATDSEAALLTSLFGTVGLVASAAPAIAPEPGVALVLDQRLTRTFRPIPPDPPPPRL
jgi:hypothetical protein